MSETARPYAYYEEVDGKGVDYVKLIDGRSIAYKRSGHGSHTIVDFHGSPGSRLNPIPRPFRLSLRDVNILTFDRAGCGRSSRNKGRRVIDTAYDVGQVLGALRIDRVGLLARSGGVPHALGTAALLGDRVSAMVCASGLSPREFNPNWDTTTEDNKHKHGLARHDPEQLASNLAVHAEQVKSDPSALFRAIQPNFSVHDRAMLEEVIVRQLIINSHAEGLLQNAAGWIDDTIALNSEGGWGFDLDAITCPTIFWHGRQDPFSHYSQSEVLRDLTPNSASVIQPDMGHFGSTTSVIGSMLGYIRYCAAREEADGLRTQLSAEEITNRFKHSGAYSPEVVLHSPGG